MRLDTLALIAIGVWLPFGTAHAQRERDDVDMKRGCEEAGRFARRGPSHPRYEWALSQLGRCEASGPEALGALWQRAPARTRDLGRLIYVSQRLRDERLLRVLLRVLQGSDQTREVRLGALEVLVSYYEPESTLPPTALQEGSDPKYCVLGSVMDFAPRDGALPIGPQDRPSILAAVTAVASADADPLVRGAAACTAAALQLL